MVPVFLWSAAKLSFRTHRHLSSMPNFCESVQEAKPPGSARTAHRNPAAADMCSYHSATESMTHDLLLLLLHVSHCVHKEIRFPTKNRLQNVSAAWRCCCRRRRRCDWRRRHSCCWKLERGMRWLMVSVAVTGAATAAALSSSR